MTDLRQRLAEARLASDNVDSDGVTDDDAAAGMALEVFAEWLRERAREYREHVDIARDGDAAFTLLDREGVLRTLADEIAPKGDDRG